MQLTHPSDDGAGDDGAGHDIDINVDFLDLPSRTHKSAKCMRGYLEDREGIYPGYKCVIHVA